MKNSREIPVHLTDVEHRALKHEPLVVEAPGPVYLRHGERVFAFWCHVEAVGVLIYKEIRMTLVEVKFL